jgi:hypothetical protein
MWRTGNIQNASTAINLQSAIGWEGILEGCIGTHWKIIQEKFYLNQSIQRSGVRWAQLVVRRLWKIAWEMWQNRNKKAHQDDQEEERTKNYKSWKEKKSIREPETMKI